MLPRLFLVTNRTFFLNDLDFTGLREEEEEKEKKPS